MKPSYGSLFSGVGGFDAGFDVRSKLNGTKTANKSLPSTIQKYQGGVMSVK